MLNSPTYLVRHCFLFQLKNARVFQLKNKKPDAYPAGLKVGGLSRPGRSSHEEPGSPDPEQVTPGVVALLAAI